MDNPVAKALHDGLDTLRRRGWTQWDLCDSNGRVCARGALLDVTDTGTYWFEIEEVLPDTQRQADDLLSRVAAEQYPDRVQSWMAEPIVAVNNHDDTTQEDVERIFEKAIVKAYETL